MNTFRRVIQPDNWSCLAAVAAMIAGEEIADVVAFVGHDGSARDPEGNPQHPEHRQAFTDHEILRYLVDRGFSLGVEYSVVGHQEKPSGWCEARIHAGGNPWAHEGPWLSIRQTAWPAVVTVESQRLPGGLHAVLWTGECVLDPNPEAPARANISDYEVRAWWPVIVPEGSPAAERMATAAGG